MRGRSIVEHLHSDLAKGLALLVATACALALANSGVREAFHALWEAPREVGVAGVGARTSLHAVINDGLMTVFFLLIGLEVKSEFVEGELSHRRKGIVPIAAAVTGALVPALIYLAVVLVAGAPTRGWGIHGPLRPRGLATCDSSTSCPPGRCAASASR